MPDYDEPPLPETQTHDVYVLTAPRNDPEPEKNRGIVPVSPRARVVSGRFLPKRTTPIGCPVVIVIVALIGCAMLCCIGCKLLDSVVAQFSSSEPPVSATPTVDKERRCAGEVRSDFPMYATPSRDAQVIATINGGTDLWVTGRKGLWFRVQLGEKDGWLPGEALDITGSCMDEIPEAF